jgi:hypothetical protein
MIGKAEYGFHAGQFPYAVACFEPFIKSRPIETVPIVCE